MYEIEQVSDVKGLSIEPHQFKLGDTAHETMTNDSKPIRDKKSKT